MSELACRDVCYQGILHEVTLSVQPGRICALLGPSGAGKSTLLWVLAGLWQPDSGSVSQGTGPLGMVLQQPGLWDHLTVSQHLKLVGAKRETAERVLEQMHLTDLRNRKPGRMSGGERQRLSIARALAVEPAWLLLDEPMAHLDGATRTQLFSLLRDALRQTRAGVMIATHHTEEALRLADDVAVMIDGKLEQVGTAEQVYQHPTNPDAALITGPVSLFDGKLTRPEQLTFTPDPSGAMSVISCEFHGPVYLLGIRDNHSPDTTYAWHNTPLPINTPGHLHPRTPVE